MAIFGKLDCIKNQIKEDNFQLAFNYLENISNDIFEIKNGECVKELINENMFVLKQTYFSKPRSECFFESHKKYIDIQYIVKGSEIMDVSHIDDLQIIEAYNEEKDFTKYNTKNAFSSLHIKEKELAIFYPSDGHQPCIKVDKTEQIYKVVIKISTNN